MNSKLKFAISSRIAEENINMAFLEDIKFTSSDVVKVTKYTNLYSDNIIPMFSDFSKANVDEDGNINIFNKTTDIVLTNETIIDEVSLDLIPLWYIHNVKRPYMNLTKSHREVIVNIEGNIVENLIPTGSDMKIVKNSVNVYYGPALNQYIYPRYYKVDVANNRIIMTNSGYINASGGRYKIVYDVLIPDIVLEDNYGNIVSKNKYVVEASGIEGSDVLFNVDILTWFNNTDDYVYYVKYSTMINQQQQDTKEILRIYPLYKRTDSIDNIVDRNDRRFIVDSNYVIRTLLTQYDTVYLKYTVANNEYIEVTAPDSLPKTISWYINIRAGKFVDSTSGLTYDIVERNKYILKNGEKVTNAVINPIFISDRVVKLYHRNLYTSIDNTGKYTNIYFYIDGDDKTSLIEDIDTANGIVYLKDVVSAYKDVVVSYYYRSFYVPYEYLNVNPLKKYIDNEGIVLKHVVLYMIPSDYLNLSYNRSVFHKFVYKHPGSVKDVNEEEINVSKCITYILGTDEFGTSNIRSDVEYYLNDTAPADIKPIILGVTTISQVIHPSRYDFIDIRQDAYYLSDMYDLGELLNINRDIMDYCDIGRFDGEPIYGDKVMVVRIPKRLQDKIQTLLATFDTETIRRMRYQADYDIVRMREYIMYVIKKYFKVGLYYKIYFEVV